MTSPQSSSMLAYLFLTTTTLCWGANAVFGLMAVDQVSPMVLVSLRWLGVVLLLSVIARNHVRRDWPELKKRLGFLALMGAFGFAGFNALFYIAAYSTSAINLGIIQGGVPMFVLLLAFVAYRTPITPLQVTGVLVTLIGVLTVASAGEMARLTALAFNFGDTIMIGAGFLYAGYTVALRQRPSVSALSLLTIIATAALAASLVFLAIEASLGLSMMPTPKGWAIIGLITIFPSFLAQLCFIRGVELIGPGRAGIFINLVPVFASFFAVVFLQEPFQMYHGAALASVLGGIWLAERGKPA